MGRNASQDLNNPNLFAENEAGNYEYGTTDHGKFSRGQLQHTDHPERDSKAQAAVGNSVENPYGKHDGGHGIGARFGGSPKEENLTPMDRNLNRGDYKRMENGWDKSLQQGDKVFVNVESYSHDNSARPSNYMGYYITEHTNENGETTRELEYISMNNESRSEQESWDQALSDFYAENPEAVEEDRSLNTAMEFHYDEETDTISANPYYDAGESAAGDQGSASANSGSAGSSYDSGADEDSDADA